MRNIRVKKSSVSKQKLRYTMPASKDSPANYNLVTSPKVLRAESI